VLYALAALGLTLLLRNIFVIFLELGDEMNQGAIWRIIFFHVPGFFVFASMALAGLVFAVLSLRTRKAQYDSLLTASVEVGCVFIATTLVTGMFWGRIIWGIWWTWDARLTSTLVCFLMYVSLLMLRQAVPEPAERARGSAVLAILFAPAMWITFKAIEWYRTQHPGPVLSIRNGGGMAPGWEAMLYWNFLALLLIAVPMVMIRARQESGRREIAALRREALSY
jgi:heme exporter protein C